MKTQVEKTDQHKRQISVEIEGEIVQQKFDKIYDNINKQAKVPGFRSGNVPRDILEKHYEILSKKEPGISRHICNLRNCTICSMERSLTGWKCLMAFNGICCCIIWLEETGT